MQRWIANSSYIVGESVIISMPVVSVALMSWLPIWDRQRDERGRNSHTNTCSHSVTFDTLHHHLDDAISSSLRQEMSFWTRNHRSCLFSFLEEYWVEIQVCRWTEHGSYKVVGKETWMWRLYKYVHAWNSSESVVIMILGMYRMINDAENRNRECRRSGMTFLEGN